MYLDLKINDRHRGETTENVSQEMLPVTARTKNLKLAKFEKTKKKMST
jgi:hypothetical protein